MKPYTFIRKHSLKLTKNETFCVKKAIDILSRAADKNHGLNHVYRLLTFLDQFVLSREYRKISKSVNLKVVFLSILWHDCWRSKKDAQGPFSLLWYTIAENRACSRLFLKHARKMKIKQKTAKEIAYCLRKHCTFILFTPRTLEAKILRALDKMDEYCENRMLLLVKKFLIVKPIRAYYLKQAKLAIRLFVKPDSEDIHYFKWIEKRILKKKDRFIRRLWKGVREYETLLNLKTKGMKKELQKKTKYLRKKYLKRRIRMY